MNSKKAKALRKSVKNWPDAAPIAGKDGARYPAGSPRRTYQDGKKRLTS